MAILKKGARKITVNNVQYLWKIRHKPTYNQECFNGYATASVSIPTGDGQLLYITFPFGIYQSITPKTIADCIQTALNEGWQPNEKGVFNYYHKMQEPAYLVNSSYWFRQDFKNAQILEVEIHKNRFYLKLKPVKPYSSQFDTGYVEFRRINNIKKTQRLFDDLMDAIGCETEINFLRVNDIRFDESIDSFTFDYHVCLDIEGVDPLTIHCQSMSIY